LARKALSLRDVCHTGHALSGLNSKNWKFSDLNAYMRVKAGSASSIAMWQDPGVSSVSRRVFLISTVAAAGLKPLLAFAESATPLTHERSQEFKEAFAEITKGMTPAEGRMAVELPQFVENGAFVPIIIQVDSPMTEADHVKAIHILATANPVARIATFHLSPVNAVARVQSRIRLAKNEDVVTLAELSTGEMLIKTTFVKVGIGGCDV
jgi:sulfur-oxidizing protein SoxY